MTTLNGLAQFPDLPLEITEQIINNLRPKELLLVAKTCHQFNLISLRRFFLVHKIDEPAKQFHGTLDCLPPYHREGSLGPGVSRRVSSIWSSLSLQDPGANPFEGLAVAFNITTIEDFRCTVNASTSYRIGGILNLLKKVLWAVQRLQHVGKVTLMFELGDHFLVSEENQGILHQWREVMGGLLNAFVERGCHSLKVYNGSFPWQATSPTNFLPAQRTRLNILQRTKTLFAFTSKSTSPTLKGASVVWASPIERGLVEPPQNPLKLVHLSKAAHDSSQIKHLQISSRMLLHPPCSHWTHSILQTPNLTSLHLYSIRETTWTHILSWLIPPVQPRLRELSIELCYGIPLEPLINFVIGLKAVTHLKLAYPVPVVRGHKLPTSWKPGSRLKTAQVLPNLVSLHAFPDWIQFLCPGLTSQSWITPLTQRFRRPTGTNPTPLPPPPPPTRFPARPDFKHLHILPRTSWTSRSEFDFDLSLNILRPVLQSSAFPFASPTFRVALELNDMYTVNHMERDVVQWGGDPFDSDVNPTRIIVLGSSTDDLNTHPRIPHQPRTTQRTRKHPELPAGYEPYDRITELIICNPGILHRHQCKIACEFFSMWKGVKRVELRTLVLDAWNEENVKMLMREAKAACRNVKEFVLGGEVYAVEDFV